jgi:SulP family sulfate permease
VESRILISPVDSTAWRYASVPDAWRLEPQRNATAGALAAIVTLPLAMGLGTLVFSPFGPAFVTIGVLAGLYAAAFLGLIAVLAGARGVAIYAPRTLVSFMIAAVCGDLLANAPWLPKDDPVAVASAVFLLLAMAGAFQLAFALAHLARLVKFIPTPVMAGFQNAAAIIITLSQLHLLLGLPARPALGEWGSALGTVSPLTALVGGVTLALVFYGTRLVKRLPALLTALLGGTLCYYLLVAAGFSASLGATLGPIPVALPDGHQLAGIMALTLRPGFLEALPGMIAAAASIAVVASLDALISAKVVETLSGQRGNSTRELLCIGTANALTPLLGGIAGSLSLAATGANHKGGARTSLSLLIHALLFLAMVPLLAPLLSRIPNVVIAALLIHAGTQLFDRWTLQLIRKVASGKAVNWESISIDLAVIAMVTGIAIAGEVVIAVALGITIAVIVFTFRMSRGVIRASRYGDELHSRRAREANDVELLGAHGRKILMIELEGPMFFASAELLHNRIDAAIADNVRYVVLDVARVNEVDSTGARILQQTWQRMKTSGAQLLICGQDEHHQTGSMLRDLGVADSIGEDHWCPDLDRALEWCENHLLATLKTGIDPTDDLPFEQLDITRGLVAAEREALQGVLTRREFAAGEKVFSEGDAGDALFIIVRGSASVRLQLGAAVKGAAGSTGTTAAGDRRLVTFSAGTIFGEMALLDREPRSATVTADEPLACYVLEHARFEELAMAYPRIGMTVLGNLGRELSLRMRRANRTLAERA